MNGRIGKWAARGVLAGTFLLGLAAVSLEAASIIMPLVQVKAGMKGKGKSVFEAGRIEEFDAEILGVLENYRPKRNLILARLRGRGLETSGRHRRDEREPGLYRRQAHRRRRLQLPVLQGAHRRDHSHRGDAGHRTRPRGPGARRRRAPPVWRRA